MTVAELVKRYPEVQLATLMDQPPGGEGWIHEIKLDGYRLLGFVSGSESTLRTRNGKDWSSNFPAILAALGKLKVSSAVLDMEAVVLNRAGKSSFQDLQAALGGGGKAESIVGFVFDLLHLDGKDLTQLRLLERKQKLAALLSHAPAALRYSEHIEGQGAEMFAKACEAGLEGIIAKQADAPYLPGRQKSWLKIKCALRQEFVILGYSGAKKGERALGALYLGYSKDGTLQYAGKVGTGFSMKLARELVERFDQLAAPQPVLTRPQTRGVGAGEYQSIHWVKPDLLCEVSFTEWTNDGRIRHPSFQGLRDDKNAGEVKMEKPMKAGKTGKLVLAGVNITHPDRVISETGRITKGELAAYYAGVADFILPGIVRRPLSLLRCPSGIDGGDCFYQRNPGKGLGKHVHPFEFTHKGKKFEYLYIEDEKGLLEVVQMGSIEFHPWGATIDRIDYPDRLIFDLDPAPDVPLEALKLAAQDLRQRLRQKGMEPNLKTTGGKGLHVIVSLPAEEKWGAIKSFAASLAEEMVTAAPQAYVATMSKSQRTGKIFIDYFRNDYTATAIADYAVRARPGAPVALPIAWNELGALKAADQFTMRDVLHRLKIAAS